MILYRFLCICCLIFDVQGLLRQLANTDTFDSPEEPVVLKLVEERGEKIWEGHLKEWLMFEVSDPQRPGSFFSLSLRHNRNVNATRPIYVMREGRIVPYYVPVLKHVAFYQDIEGSASFGIICELRNGGWKQFELEGVLQRGNQSYIIYPERISSDYLDEDKFHKHVLRRINQAEHLEADYTDRNDLTILGAQVLHRPKREVKAYKVEILLVVDYSIYQFWYTRTSASSDQERHDLTLETIRQYFAFFLNGMDLRFKNVIHPEFSIRLLHVALYIADKSSRSSWTEGNTSPNAQNPARPLVDATAALSSFTSWVNFNYGLPVFDHAMGFTTYDLTSEGKTSVTGLSYQNEICGYKTTSVIENYFDFGGLVFASHELAHNLGAMDDGDGNACDPSQRYIMSHAQGVLSEATARNRWYFSSCSIEGFRSNLNDGAGCLTNHYYGGESTYLDTYLVQEPGQVYWGHSQCAYSVGSGSTVCWESHDSTGYGNICSVGLYCHVPGSNDCSSITPSRGTSCGNQQAGFKALPQSRPYGRWMCDTGKWWCMNGECVSDPNAPAVPDSCPFGDEPGIISDGKKCSELISSQPNACYTFAKQCCASCLSIQNTQNTGCEYGDKESFCTTMDKSQCYEKASVCCSTCPTYFDPNAQAGCEYGDKESFCTTMDKSQCYEKASVCCSTCPTYFDANAQPGCEYGDKESFCTTMDKSQCYEKASVCCSTCPTYFDPNSQPGCEYGDKESFCTTMDKSQCYENASVCCSTCPTYSDPNAQPGCEYGDKESFCTTMDKSQCYENASVCCSTCPTYSDPNAQPGCEYGDKESFCTTVDKSQCYEDASVCCSTCPTYSDPNAQAGCEYGDKESFCTTMHRSQCYENASVCCSTCPTYSDPNSQPGCEYGDKESFCETVHRSRCYDQADVCCNTCPTYYDPNAKPGCEYGDRESFCETMDQSECRNQADVCCSSCPTNNDSNSVETGCQSGDTGSICAAMDPGECYEHADVCCSQCSTFQNPNAEPGCQYGDMKSFCATVDAGECYTHASECCSTCRNFQDPDGQPGCQYGDMESLCATMFPGQCYQHASVCCKTCPTFHNPNAQPGCEYGDQWAECDPTQCSQYNATVLSHCCETCQPGETPCHRIPSMYPTTTQRWTPRTPWKWWLTTAPIDWMSNSVHSLRLSRHDKHCVILISLFCSFVSMVI